MTKPKVTVLMSVYNGGIFLDEAIDSILKQTYKSFEFIIINDCSIDNSLKIINKYADNDIRIKVINNSSNLGLTKSLNKGIKQASGDYIARQDADDVSEHDRLEKQYNFFKKNKKYTLLGTSFNIIDQNNNIIGKKMGSSTGDVKTRLKEQNQFVHGSLMFKKSYALKIDGYDVFFKQAQDYDFNLRISKLGEVGNLEDRLYNLRYHESNISNIKRVTQMAYANIARHREKFYSNKEDIFKKFIENKKNIKKGQVALFKEALLFKNKKSAYLILKKLYLKHFNIDCFYYFVIFLIPKKIMTKIIYFKNK